MTDDRLNPENDPFGPPAISTIVRCIHCGEEYDSYKIEWRIEQGTDGSPHGFWCCPMPGCDGKGFGFDIFPIDPEYRDENGELMWCDDEEDFEGDDEGNFNGADEDYEIDEESVGGELDDGEVFGQEDEGEWLLDDELSPGRSIIDREDDIPY